MNLDLLLINVVLDIEGRKKYFESLKVSKDTPRQISPHIGMAYLLAATKQRGIKSKFIDMFIDNFNVSDIIEFINRNRPLAIGFTGYTTQIKETATVAGKIKELFPSIKTFIGGPHATSMPLETLNEFSCFDYTFCGEAEESIISFFENDLNVGDILTIGSKTKNSCISKRITNLDLLPFPAWDMFKLSSYSGADPHRTKLELPISTSRGCPGTCVFCVRPFGRKRIVRSVNSVIEEVDRNIKDFGCEALVFFDETLIENNKIDVSIDLFNEFIKKGINKKLKWSCEMRIDLCDLSLFKLMREAGCYYIFFGAESADEGVLRRTGKPYTSEQIKKTILAAKETGITCAASFILGLPGETRETAMKSIEMGKFLDIYSCTFPIAVPFPGTALRRSAEVGRYGLRILTNDWDLYGKQYPGIMESESLNIGELRLLQSLAYSMIPKKDIV
jgi:radical SAM superfamily enzyme YgiQ (UPF0313 family)